MKIKLSIIAYITSMLLYLLMGSSSKYWQLFWCISDKLAIALFLYLLSKPKLIDYHDRKFIHFCIGVCVTMSLMYVSTIISDINTINSSVKLISYVIFAGLISLIINYFATGIHR